MDSRDGEKSDDLLLTISDLSWATAATGLPERPVTTGDLLQQWQASDHERQQQPAKAVTGDRGEK